MKKKETIVESLINWLKPDGDGSYGTEESVEDKETARNRVKDQLKLEKDPAKRKELEQELLNIEERAELPSNTL